MTRLLAVVGLLTFLAFAVAARGQVTCRPNIFGGQDCEGPGERSSSRPNIFGGFDTEGPGGTRSTSQPNIFDGESGCPRHRRSVSYTHLTLPTN